MIGTLLQARVPVVEAARDERIGLKELLVRPWRDSWQLIRGRKEFAGFQWGFMICGFAIMLIQPALPLFAVDVLGVSYTQMAAAVSIAKGLGFVISSPLWGQWVGRHSIHRMSSWVFLTMRCFR